MLSRDGGDNPLLRFDVAAIPANAAIVAATLALYNTTGDQIRARRGELFQVLKEWDEGTEVAVAHRRTRQTRRHRPERVRLLRQGRR